jgi:DNA-directed RNA polymerase subunit RPC12/RpoP
MHEVVFSPSCKRQLQVPDDLPQGQNLRCPACEATFDITVPPVAESSAKASDTPGAPPLPEDVPQTVPVAQRRRRSEYNVEQVSCPDCGHLLPAYLHQCPACGADIDEEDERPWEEWDEVRRDWESPRGGLILTLGIISIVLAPLSLCCSVFGLISELVGMGLGIGAWVMGRRDLKKMEARLMDPSGQGTTQAGYICGIVGTIMSGLFIIGFLLLIAFYGWMFYSFSKAMPPSPYMAPMPAKSQTVPSQINAEEVEDEDRELLPPPVELESAQE